MNAYTYNIQEKTPINKTPSQQARNFQNNMINDDLNTVPGLGKFGITRLAMIGVTKTSHLVGQFFMLERDEVRMIEFLEDQGIQNRLARELVENFKQKFGHI